MGREAIASRLEALEQSHGSARRVGVLRVPGDVDVYSAAGREWLAANVRGAVMLAPEQLEEGEWLRGYRPTSAGVEHPAPIGRPSFKAGRVVWAPQHGPQTALLACTVPDVLFGGARGGGKSDGMLGDWLYHADRHGRHARGAMFRRSYPEFTEMLNRCGEILPALGWKRNITEKSWTSPRGAKLVLRYLENDADADAYMGHSFTWLGFDELGNWPSLAPVDKLRATLRSAHGVTCVMRASANPGGVGHNQIKARYVDPAPPFTPFTGTDGARRLFIPSRVEDNRELVDHDPGYVDRLKQAGPEWLTRAWLFGDWDVTAGGIVDDLWRRPVHVLAPFPIPSSWRIDRSFDWGSSRPFSVGWWAESDGTVATMADGSKRHFPRGTVLRIAEWYGTSGAANEGCRMLAVDIARGILERERNWFGCGDPAWKGPRVTVQAGPADSSIYAAENGVCIADDMEKVGVTWREADKSPGSRRNGLERLRRMLSAALVAKPEDPCLYIFDTCAHWIRTVPTLPRDPRNVEDVDTKAEDHAYDESRYRLMVKPAATIGFSSCSV
jgi:hypothetical protein